MTQQTFMGTYIRSIINRLTEDRNDDNLKAGDNKHKNNDLEHFVKESGKLNENNFGLVYFRVSFLA